jgi:glycosyltransferase involved in cell wall biosynthesis
MDKRKIKVCCVANADAFVKFLLLPQLKFLLKEGYEVSVVCSKGKWTGDIEKEGIKVKAIKIKRKISPFYDLITLYRLWNYFRKEKFDIVHTNNPKPGLLGQLAAKMARVPIIINTIHGFYFQNNSSYLKRKFFIGTEKIAAKCSNLILFVNKEDMETASKEGICNDSVIKYLGGGININRFNPSFFTQAFLKEKKEKLGIKSDCRVIGIVARLVREKGYLDLFEAFKIILKIFPKTTLLVIGAREPEKKDAVNPEVVKDYGIEKDVIFLGERNDVEQIYPLMDIFVLPSYREGLGVAILEAMAEERPVVASDIRGCREEIENGKNGILIPTKSPAKLAQAVISLLNSPDKAKRLGEDARLRVEKYFSENLIFDRIKEEYLILLRKKCNRFDGINCSLPVKS